MSNYVYTPYIWPLLMPALSSLALAGFAWRRRREQVFNPIFAIFCLAIAFWSVAYVGQVTGATYDVKRFWNDIKFLGIVVVTPAWFVFTLHYTGRAEWLRSRWLWASFAFFGTQLLWVFTNHHHHLWYTALWMPEGGLAVELKASYGWVYIVYMALAYVYLVASLALLAQFHRRTSPVHRSQARLLIVAQLLPVAASLAYQTTRLTLFGTFNLNTMALAASGAVMAIALWRYRLLDILPIASRLVIQQMADAVVVLDAEDRVADINPMAERISGKRASAVVGKPVHEAFPIEYAQFERYCDARSLNAEMALGAGDARRYYDVRLSTLHAPDNRLIGRVVTLRDVTARKQAEAALAQLRSDWTAMLVHDLRKPLSTVLGALDALEFVSDMDADERAKMLGMIRQRVEGMTELTTALLQLEQLEAGTVPLTLETFDLAEMLYPLEIMYGPETSALGVHFQIKLPPYPVLIHADRLLIARTLDNLARNALRHTPAGGNVTVSGGADTATGRAWVTVADTGEGIDAADLPYIFDRFTRGKQRKGVGYGLGLTFCKLVMEAHRGKIDVQSAIGQGSVFTLTLPVSPSTSIVWSAPAAEAPAPTFVDKA